MLRWQIGFFGLAFTLLIAAVLFGSAGRWDLPMFGVYLGLWLLFALITAATIDLDLMKERLRPQAAGRDSLPLLRLLAAGPTHPFARARTRDGSRIRPWRGSGKRTPRPAGGALTPQRPRTAARGPPCRARA